MTPGYYRVLLQDSKINVELTATERTGLHRYTFPQTGHARVLVDLAHTAKAHRIALDAKGALPPAVRWASLRLIGDDTIVGGRCMDVWGKGREIYFAMKFSKPFQSAAIYRDGVEATGTRDAKARSLRCVLSFKTMAGEAVLVKTGISGVSVEGAEANLRAESPGWDFDAARKAAKDSWLRELSRLDVRGSDRKQLEIFYTGLYHMMLAPTLFDDTDGQYRGMDGKVHTLPTGAHNYSTFSLWDTYRALHPMFTLMMPERVPDLVECIVRMGQESGEGVPVWPLQGRETGCMDGDHSAPVVAEALVKGFAGIDAKAAYASFRRRELEDDYRGMASYRKLGYVPCDEQDGSASKTLDYAYDDHAVAAIARAAGAQGDSDALLARSRSFTKLYDKESGFIRPRFADGHWAGPFDPKGINISGKWRDYTEANAWQTTFCVQHDPHGLIAMLGCDGPFVKKLDELFNQSSELPPDMPKDVSGMVGQYAHGNEPSHHIAYLYNYAGVPEKTQARVRSLLDNMYDNKPDGMAGNEDCGQMSAWFVISALGLYAVDPVSAMYDFGTPLFDRVEMHVGAGKKLVIEAKRQTPKSIYIERITLNGRGIQGSQVAHADLVKGGRLVFTLRDTPGTQKPALS